LKNRARIDQAKTVVATKHSGHIYTADQYQNSSYSKSVHRHVLPHKGLFISLKIVMFFLWLQHSRSDAASVAP
jgi:hypothetical protein